MFACLFARVAACCSLDQQVNELVRLVVSETNSQETEILARVRVSSGFIISPSNVEYTTTTPVLLLDVFYLARENLYPIPIKCARGISIQNYSEYTV